MINQTVLIEADDLRPSRGIAAACAGCVVFWALVVSVVAALI